MNDDVLTLSPGLGRHVLGLAIVLMLVGACGTERAMEHEPGSDLGLTTEEGLPPDPGAEIAEVSRPTWASNFGQDAHGIWADLTIDDVSQRMRWIAPGTFLRGSPHSEEGGRANEWVRPIVSYDSGEQSVRQQPVTLSRGYWMAATPCTQALWQALMGSNPSNFTGDLQRPVERVSWGDTQKFLRQLNARVPGLEARLPTEAEWEYAARAGTTGARYGELDTIAWHRGNAAMRTHPVGSKQANAWGLYDMLGNVWEWCADWYGLYQKDEVLDPTGPDTGSARVRRGGSWFAHADFCRAAARSKFEPDKKYNFLGFRFAAPAQ